MTAPPPFNTLDQPWLPVRFLDGTVAEVGLLEAFARASDIQALAETAPPNLVAQYRLLLAITHRALTRVLDRWTTKERHRWYQEGLPASVIREYLEQYRERFDLFDSERPFMQVACLAEAAETRDKLKPWTQISLASANGNTPAVFDHAYDTEPAAISAAQALRHLLGFLQFTPGGLVKCIRDSDKAGPLANTAAALPIGGTLAQTLALALHPNSPPGLDDRPSWEKPAPCLADLAGDPTLSTGPNDRYTRLSRAVQLVAESDGRIRWLRFAAGLALAEDVAAPDPMASYRAGSNGQVRLSFIEGRAFWRDLPALLPEPTKQVAHPAAVLNFASSLHGSVSFESVEQPILVAGLASDQAKLLRWRVEQWALPTPLLEDADLARRLRERLGEAEERYKKLRQIAVTFLAQTFPDPGSKDTRARAASQIDNGPLAATYFAELERGLSRLMHHLAETQNEDADRDWRKSQYAALQAAWQRLRDAAGQHAKIWIADAKTSARRNALFREVKADPSETIVSSGVAP